MSVDILGMDAAFAAIDQAFSELESKADAAVSDAGEECKVEAKARARVDTGEMRDKIEHEHKHLESTVTAGAEHSIYNEFGTRYMSAQPFLMPGFEIARMHFMENLKQL